MAKQTKQQRYESLVQEYIEEFKKKQEFDDSDAYRVGDCIGEVYFVCDYFFSFDDIRYDVDNNIQKGVIIDWHNYTVDAEGKGSNYKNYLKGAR